MLQYPINERLLEVWMAVHLGVSPENVVVQLLKVPQLEDNLLKKESLKMTKIDMLIWTMLN